MRKRRALHSLAEVKNLVSDVKQGKKFGVSVHQHVLTRQQIGLLGKAGWVRVRRRRAGLAHSRGGKLAFGYVWFSPKIKKK